MPVPPDSSHHSVVPPLTQRPAQGTLTAIAFFLLVAMICVHNVGKANHSTPNSGSTEPSGPQHNGDGEFGEASLLRIDLNQADWRELALLPGVGEVLAKRIVSHRAQRGEFRTLDDLDRVHGIGDKTIERLSKLCEVHQDFGQQSPRHRVAKLPSR